MAAPKFAPAPTVDDARGYERPDHVPDPWLPDRPGDIRGFQPEGGRLGYQGPDQGFALKIANTYRGRLQLSPGESEDDAVRGCLGIALRRASMFSRAPVVHDLELAFTMWGYLGADAPADLVEVRRDLFAGVANVVHHYDEARALVDMVPQATLRLSPQHAAARVASGWRELVGA